MADSFTANLNLRKPEVGHADSTWGGVAGLNGDLDILDAIFAPGGGGTSVGLNIGAGKVLNVAGAINWVRLPPGTDQLVSLGATQTLTNKTLVAPFFNGGFGTVQLADGSFGATKPLNNNSTAIATTAYVDAMVATVGGGAVGTELASYIGAGHSNFTNSNVALSGADTFFNGPQLPAAGNMGEVWRIDGGAYFSSTGADTFGARLFSGSGQVGPEGIVSCPANQKIFCSVCVIVVLSGPTAWILQGRDSTSGAGQLLTGSWLAAHKLASGNPPN